MYVYQENKQLSQRLHKYATPRPDCQRDQTLTVAFKTWHQAVHNFKNTNSKPHTFPVRNCIAATVRLLIFPVIQQPVENNCKVVPLTCTWVCGGTGRLILNLDTGRVNGQLHNPGKEPLIPSGKQAGGHQKHPEGFGKEKHLLPLKIIEPRYLWVPLRSLLLYEVRYSSSLNP